MSDTTASFDDVPLFGGRGSTLGTVRRLSGWVLGQAAMAAGAVAAVGATAAVVTVSGAWLVGVAMSDNPHLQARAPAGPARLALADPAAFPKSSFEARWAPTSDAMSTQVRLAALAAQHRVASAAKAVSAPPTAPESELNTPELKVTHEVARAPEAAPAPAKTQVAKLTPPAEPAPAQPYALPAAPKPVVANLAPVPLPRARPVPPPKIAEAPATAPTPKADKPAPQVAMVTPPPAPAAEKRAAPIQQAHTKGPALPGPDSRTALYDISGHTVYMPDGTRLEAHSGLGYRRDNPRFVKVKMRGPTPPNVYDLTLRKRLFHGVRAIRLNPVDEAKMHGRDGMLAHTYMLGASGQSNGCVSFKHYRRFLQAFLKGKIDRMVVVRSLDEAPASLATLVRAPRGPGRRYAANDVPLNPTSW